MHRLREKQLIHSQVGLLPLLLIGLIIIIQTQNSNFLSAQNINNVMRQISVNAVIAFGMTFIIITGNIDLSVGSIIGFSSVVGCTIMRSTGNVLVGILAALAVGTACGVCNGLIIALSGLHPFVVTLGTMTAFRGIAFLYTGGNLITGMPEGFFAINTGSVGPLPYMIIIAIVVYLLLRFVLYKTKFGQHLYAIGGREEAAVAAGIHVNTCKVAVYGIMGLLAGLAGMMLTARTVTGQADAGANYHLMAIGTSVIGGASLKGGRGFLGGTVLGVFIVGVISNGLNLLRVGSFWQDVATGLIIIAAVLIDTYSSRKREKEVAIHG